MNTPFRSLSFYALCQLADALRCVNPHDCLEHRLTHPAFADKGWHGKLTLDHLGNFIGREKPPTQGAFLCVINYTCRMVSGVH